MEFRSFGLAEPLVRAVTKQGYSRPTPIQHQAIPVVLSGRDVVGIAQTGTGKTAAFALPLLDRMHLSASSHQGGTRSIRVLVLASTRELALQIQQSFQEYGAFARVRVAAVYGGVSEQPQIRALKSGVEIVVATPGRLLDLMKQGCVDVSRLQTLVLDEADRMLDMGFFPSIRRILQRLPAKRQTLMFSATMKPEIRELADAMLKDPVSITIEPQQKTTDRVTQRVCFVPQRQKTRVLIELIRRSSPARAIVFSRTKHGADRIVRHLVAAGLTAEAIHANKSQNRRQRILEQFRGEAPPILVATDIAARGIDVDLVSHVFNHDMPTEEETYVHRIGRSGRAGATGEAISLCDPEERRMLRSIEKLIGRAIDVDPLDGVEIPDAPEAAGESSDGRRPRRRNGPRGSGRNEQSSGRPTGADRVSESGAWRFHGHETRRQDQKKTRGEQRPPRSQSSQSSGKPRRNQSGGARRTDTVHSPANRNERQNLRRNETDGFGDGVFGDERQSRSSGHR